mmetsp:Transcript_258/g.657  ORF Transcript_258/g.657 Transcript_258/m.657 type:complete len:80 (-) Transcript_258:103-342(-)
MWSRGFPKGEGEATSVVLEFPAGARMVKLFHKRKVWHRSLRTGEREAMGVVQGLPNGAERVKAGQAITIEVKVHTSARV